MPTIISGDTGIDKVQNGAVDLTADVTGTLPQLNGGTGATSLPSSVESLNGETGAITNTDLGVIGSYYLSWDLSTSGGRTLGSTYAGSTLNKINSTPATVSAGLSGTWRLIGFSEAASNVNRLYVRIS